MRYIISLIVFTVLSTIFFISCGGGAGSSGGGPSPTSYSTSNFYCPYNQQTLNNLGTTSISSESCNSNVRVINANRIPSSQNVGTFPNQYCPNTISASNVNYNATTIPSYVGTAKPVAPIIGFLNNGITLEPATASSIVNGGQTWNIEAINPSSNQPNMQLNFGLDNDNGHVQPTGKYHYHGVPYGYLQAISGGSGVPSKPILGGWAVDGFPIYLLYGYSNPNDTTSAIIPMVSSYQVLSTPSSGRPSVSQYPMGSFTQDYIYVAGLGNLDECNGATVKTQEFPNGIYAYFITTTYPYIQRCVKGSY